MRSRVLLFRVGPGLGALVALSLLWGGVSLSAPAVAQAPRELTVLVGAGRDTVVADAFFPQNLRIRAGDTVTWELNGDEFHTVSFTTGWTPAGPPKSNVNVAPGEVVTAPILPAPDLPGRFMLNSEQWFPSVASGSTYSGSGFFNSGLLNEEPLVPGMPLITSFSLTFDTPGVYPYWCLIHVEFNMQGTIEVAAAAATDVPDQAEIDAQAQAETDAITDLIEFSRVRSDQLFRSQAGPNNTAMWFVGAGNVLHPFNDPRVQLFEFLPKDLTVQAGDTVIWESRLFHTVTFVPTPPAPDPFVADPQPDGSLRVLWDPLIFDPAKPSGVFDPTRHFNSGPIGPMTPFGSSWALTFDRPGTFEYFCGVHRHMGMEGTITVVAR